MAYLFRVGVVAFLFVTGHMFQGGDFNEFAEGQRGTVRIIDKDLLIDGVLGQTIKRDDVRVDVDVKINGLGLFNRDVIRLDPDIGIEPELFRVGPGQMFDDIGKHRDRDDIDGGSLGFAVLICLFQQPMTLQWCHPLCRAPFGCHCGQVRRLERKMVLGYLLVPCGFRHGGGRYDESRALDLGLIEP